MDLARKKYIGEKKPNHIVVYLENVSLTVNTVN